MIEQTFIFNLNLVIYTINFIYQISVPQHYFSIIAIVKMHDIYKCIKKSGMSQIIILDLII